MKFIVVALLLLSGFVHAQNLQNEVLTESEVKIRSITTILQKEKQKLHDTIVANYYVQLAQLSAEELDYQSSIAYCDTILKEYPKLDFYKLKAIEEEKAMYFQEAGKTEKTVKILLKILSEFEDRGDYKESAQLNKRIGVIFLKMDDLTNAEYHLKESIQHARKVGDTETEGYSLMSYGNRFKKDNKFDEAEEKYKESIVIANAHGYKRLLAGNYNNYGSLYRMKGDLDKAMDYYLKAVKINKEISNDKWLSYNYNNLGNIYKDKKQYDEALRHFLLSIEIKNKLGDFRGSVQTLSNIASVYDEQGNFVDAYRYLSKHSKLKDSIAELDNVNLAKKLAAEFQAEKREATIIQLNMQDQLNKQELKSRDERISYQNFLGVLMGVGIFLVVVIALIMWRSIVNRKKVNEELRDKNLQIDEQHKEIIDSINYAKRIQDSILPATDKMRSLLQKYALMYKPKDIISGDFYICDEANGSTFFGTVDCTGHGVPGAMVSLVASSHFDKTLHELNITDPGAILNRLKDEIPNALAVEHEEINDGMDMALCALSKDRSQLKFAGAYQNCWILNTRESCLKRNTDGENIILHEGKTHCVIELKGDRFGIGKSYNTTEFRTLSIDLIPGDKIMVSTDGYQDQFGGPEDKKFKVRALRQLVLEHGEESAETLLSTLEKALLDWQGHAEQVDDICLMIVEI